MRASYQWLKQLSGIDATPDDYAARLTRGGVEVEGVTVLGAGLDGIVIAEVRGKKSHPTKDGLSLVTLFDGAAESEVVCGAGNVPAPGGRVLFARMGARIPSTGVEISERKIAGVVSRGMICSEAELGIGPDSDGIFILDADHPAKPGDAVAAALGLADVIFELGLTPNRPDCLGHVGLARELAAASGVPFTLPAPKAALQFAATSADAGVSVTIEDAARCPRYGAVRVSNVTLRPSPFAIRYRLHSLGLRPISNVVDATNVIMLEWGHPIHGFDLAKVHGARISIRVAKAGEQLTTLDGVARTMSADDLLICDGEGPVAVAGVMGGGNSEISATTRDVLIECAYFDPRSVRRAARRLGMHTDASHRFERGVDPNAVPAVLASAAALLAEVAGGAVVTNAIDVYPKTMERASISLRASRIALVLGTEVAVADVRRILAGIGCEVSDNGADAWTVLAPTHRPDLLREEDLIEEIARLRGYDLIPTRTPRVRPSATSGDPMAQFARATRNRATAAGLHEAINYSFVDEKDLARAKVSTEAVRLQNPLSEERNVLRTSLLPGLVTAVVRAQRRQVDDVALFELGRTFAPQAGTNLAREQRVVAFVLAGSLRDWIGQGHTVDFFDGKGVLHALVQPVLGVSPDLAAVTDTDAPPFLHPRRSARIAAGGIALGVLGELHPDVAQAFDVTGRAVYGEVDMERLYEAMVARGTPRSVTPPQFPASRRDIALVVSDTHSAADIMAGLTAQADGLAESIELFDLYRGEQVPAGHKSLAFRISYRDPQATLTDTRVEGVHAKVVAAASKLFGAQIR